MVTWSDEWYWVGYSANTAGRYPLAPDIYEGDPAAYWAGWADADTDAVAAQFERAATRRVAV